MKVLLSLSSSMRVRKLTAQDLERYLALEKRIEKESKFLRRGLSRSKLEQATKRKVEDSFHGTSSIFVLEDAETLVGEVTLDAYPEDFSGSAPNTMIIVTIAVLNDYQSKGGGKLLLHKAMNHARQEGARRVALYLKRKNTRAKKFYDKYGFKLAEEYSDADEYFMVYDFKH
jgi:ribosomal protein S18 acetylase RimI-like enzyme